MIQVFKDISYGLKNGKLTPLNACEKIELACEPNPDDPELIKAIGEMIFKGIWYSDACELVWMTLGFPAVKDDSFWETVCENVNEYTYAQKIVHGREVPVPTYENHFK
jgi:hypothetical protein